MKTSRGMFDAERNPQAVVMKTECSFFATTIGQTALMAAGFCINTRAFLRNSVVAKIDSAPPGKNELSGHRS